LIRRRIWRQGNSVVLTLSPTHLEFLGVDVGDYVYLRLADFQPHGSSFVAISSHTDLLINPRLQNVDKYVDKYVDK